MGLNIRIVFGASVVNLSKSADKSSICFNVKISRTFFNEFMCKALEELGALFLRKEAQSPEFKGD